MWTRVCRLIYKQWFLFVCVTDVTCTMLLIYLAHLALMHGMTCLDAQLEGDLALDLQVAKSPGGKGRWFRVTWKAGSQAAQKLVFKMSQQQQNVTVAPQLECVYQYPERTQVDALLSNMMNELTKVSVRANEYMKETRRDKNGLKKASLKNIDVMFVIRGSSTTDAMQEEKTEPVQDERTEAVKEKLKDKHTRFEVVHKKQKRFFDLIYSNMTDEYRNFYNATFERVDRAGRDPCTRQPEVKQLWRDLLHHAHHTLRSAARRFVDEYLRDTPKEKKAQVRKRLHKFLKAVLGKMRENQLNILCETYQLCYNDLLE